MSVVGQVMQGVVFRYDMFDLIPNCRFFAPQPVSFDYRVLLQVGDEKGDWSYWFPLFNGDKRWFCFVWNPKHRMHKLVFEIVRQLSALPPEAEFRHISYPYLLLLSACSRRARAIPGTVRVRYMVVSSPGFEGTELSINLVSNEHRV
ncbi:MAG: hypothetical protein R2815_10190 [Flavobacteriales bacterium]